MDDTRVGQLREPASERGATLVQYVLAVVLIGLLGLFAVTRVGSGSKKSFDAAHTGVTTHDAPSGGTGGSGGSGDGTESGGGVGGPGGPTTPPTTTPTTTAAPTTTSTTTTTAPPTTTTTTAPPKAASATFLSSSGIADSSSVWHGRAEIAVRSDSGTGVTGAQVSLLIEGWANTGGGGTRRSSTTVTVNTDANGRHVIDTAGLARTGGSRVNSVTIKVQTVVMPSGFTWSGATPSVTINRV